MDSKESFPGGKDNLGFSTDENIHDAEQHEIKYEIPIKDDQGNLIKRADVQNQNRSDSGENFETPTSQSLQADTDMNRKQEYALVPNSVEIELNSDKAVTNQIEATNLKSESKNVDETKQAGPNASKGQNDVKIKELFRFADPLDKFLILIGCMSALGSAGLYPLMFLNYGRIAGTFVDIQKDRVIRQTSTSQSLTTSSLAPPNSCYDLEDSNTDFDSRIEYGINFYVTVGFVSLFLNYLANVCLNTSAERQIRRMRNALYKSIIRQDQAFFDKNTPGELNSIITGNIETIKIGIGFKLSDFIAMLGRGIACIILALVQAWKFSIVFLAIIPIMITTTICMVMMIKKYTIREFIAYGNAGRIAQEVLSSIRTILSFGIQKLSIKNYEEKLKDAESMAIKKGMLAGCFGGLTSGVFNACFGIGIFYATYLTRTDCENYNAGNLVQSFFCMTTSTFAISQALPYLKDLAEARGTAKKLFSILETVSAVDVFTSNGKKIDNLKGEIEFENVFFSYPQRKDIMILKGLTVEMPAGKTIALVGSSGGGKSTVVSLLQRFYLPASGKIKIDGHLIEDLDVNWLREQMALVSQEPILFSTSIRENIRLGRMDATDAEIEEAAKNANAHNFIMNCSNKYDTHCGERGVQLSGGQKQRIAIARALIRNPKILLLDEATSALDYESEKIVQDALDKAKLGRTTIIIAHRLSTIRNADIIVGMANGQLKEIGTHDELMKLKGIYYELVTTQTTDETKEEDNEKEKPDLNYVLKQSKKLSIKEESSSESSDSEDEQDVKNKNDRKFSVYSDENKTSIQIEIKKKKKVKKPFRYEKKLLKLQKPEAGWIVLGSICQLISGAVFPGIALIFSEIYTIFAEPDPVRQEELSLIYMGIIIGIAFVNFVCVCTLSYSFSYAGARLTKRIRIKMFESMLRQEIAFHDLDENRSSVLSTQLASSAPFCKGITSDKISLLSQGISGVGFSVIIAFIINWKLCLLMLVFVPISFISGVISGRATVNTKVKGKSSTDEGGRLTIETVDNIKTVISLGRERYFLNEFESIFKVGFNKGLALLHLQGFFYSLSNCMLFFIQAAAFSFGYTLIMKEELEVSNMYKIYATITFSSMILGRVYSQLPDQTKALDSAKVAFKIIQRKSKIDSLDESGLRPERMIGEIKFENVSFNYPNRPNVRILRGFNLTVKPGQTNALVGPSGSGKSTTCSLLLRFYDVDSGKVTIDGIDIRQLNINWLRSQIGIVSQEPTLFNTTIYQNICYGDLNRENIPLSEVIEATTQSNIHNKIETLTDKYDTVVGSKGSQLSGGEKQRIAIARALIRKPKILLLDEATSALDTQSEHIVQDALDKAQKGRTCMIIAHRLTTIQNSDKITVVKDGAVLEEGTHTELLNNKNFYHKLQNQNKKTK